MEVTIEAVSFIHVGSGAEELEGIPEPAELEKLIKNKGFETAARELATKISAGYMGFAMAGGKPCIPGSSVKGNIRSRIELSLVNRNGRVRSCFIRASQPAFANSPNAWRHKKVWGNVLYEDRGPQCDLTKNNKVCLVCDIFGTAGLTSLVMFSDFVGNSISLQRLDAGHGMKLITAPPGSRFKGTIVFYSLKPYEIGLLLHGMGLTNSVTGRNVMIGRLKYVGGAGGRPFGKVRYTVNSMKIIGSTYTQQTFSPGKRLEGVELENTLKEFINAAKREFGDELQVVDEGVRS